MTHCILLVDDERSTSDLLKMFLELDGFEVLLAPTLAQARAQITPRIDAFIIDRNLAEGANGAILAREIRAGQTAAHPDSIIIFTSGDDRREDEAEEIQATRFLLKPFSPSDLSETLSQLID